MMDNIWSISQFVTYVKGKLKADFNLQKIRLQGELGNFSDYKGSGHWYFTLKDENASVHCAMFKGYNNAVDFKPQNGDMVIVTGTVNIFDARGELQIIVTEMHQAGQGNFYIQYEQTRKKLEPLGYFAEEHKKPIPKYPQQISVVTGANTAALQDIRITISKRWPSVKLMEVYAIVQGKEAIDSIVSALKIADSQHSDTIILARGGGSVDDLWCFNDEKIAKAIYDCETPVVTGIGHEIDFTIADLVADERAATPTAAAQRATPDREEIIKQINDSLYLMNNSLSMMLENYMQANDYYRQILEHYAAQGILKKADIDNMKNLMYLSLDQNIKLYNERYSNLTKQLSNAANTNISSNTANLSTLKLNLRNYSEQYYQQKSHNFVRTVEILENINPLGTLKRGYTLTKQGNDIIKSVKEVDMDSELTVTYHDGDLIVLPQKRKEN